METIGVHNAYRRSTILQAISELKKQEFSSARNFHEFKAAHRKQTLLVALFYKTYPRLMFVCSYVIYYYEVFLPIMQHYFPSVGGEGRRGEGGGGGRERGGWEEEGEGEWEEGEWEGEGGEWEVGGEMGKRKVSSYTLVHTVLMYLDL